MSDETDPEFTGDGREDGDSLELEEQLDKRHGFTVQGGAAHFLNLEVLVLAREGAIVSR